MLTIKTEYIPGGIGRNARYRAYVDGNRDTMFAFGATPNEAIGALVMEPRWRTYFNVEAADAVEAAIVGEGAGRDEKRDEGVMCGGTWTGLMRGKRPLTPSLSVYVCPACDSVSLYAKEPTIPRICHGKAGAMVRAGVIQIETGQVDDREARHER